MMEVQVEKILLLLLPLFGSIKGESSIEIAFKGVARYFESEHVPCSTLSTDLTLGEQFGK